MRILLLTQLFQPEPNHLKGLHFAKELARRGHQVEVLTGYPNYPGGSVYRGYRIRPWMRETMDGITVTRVMMNPSHNRSAIGRITCYASFALSAANLGPYLMKKPDIIHVYQGPSTLGWPAIVFRAILGVPYVLDVQDLWPESVSSSRMLPIPGVASVLGLWSKLTYRFARKIVVLSEGYRDRLISRGVPSSKIEVVYNWCDEQFVQKNGESVGFAPFDLRGRFNVVYTGNFGVVQALKTVLDAASIVENVRPDIQFVLVGDGVERLALKEIAARRNQKNVLFVPRQSQERLQFITAAADILIVHLKDDPLTRVSIPQKTQYALAAGKPVIMAVRGNAADLVREAGAGIVCRPESAEDLSHAVLNLASLPSDELRSIGNRGREFYKQKLSFCIGLEKTLSVLESAAHPHHVRTAH